MRFFLIAILFAAASLPNELPGQLAPSPLNDIILQQVKKMPVGGKYSATRTATIRLQSAAHFESGKFFVLPDAASPSYCSGATYLVFMKTIEELRAQGQLQLDYETLDQLMIRGQRDGQGVWGRWNANGPGTARLFYELGIGRNFDDRDECDGERDCSGCDRRNGCGERNQRSCHEWQLFNQRIAIGRAQHDHGHRDGRRGQRDDDHANGDAYS